MRNKRDKDCVRIEIIRKDQIEDQVNLRNGMKVTRLKKANKLRKSRGRYQKIKGKDAKEMERERSKRRRNEKDESGSNACGKKRDEEGGQKSKG